MLKPLSYTGIVVRNTRSTKPEALDEVVVL